MDAKAQWRGVYLGQWQGWVCDGLATITHVPVYVLVIVWITVYVVLSALK